MTRREFLVATIVVLFGDLPFVGEVIRAWARRFRRAELERALADEETWKRVGENMLLPVKDLVDYEGWTRRVYLVHPLARDELLDLKRIFAI